MNFRTLVFHYFTHYLFWPLFFVSHLLMVSLIAWHLLAQVNFAYPLAYKLLDINAQVQEFAPHNLHKKDFEYTTAQEHWDLFAQITQSIQNHGKGLAEIEYTLPNGSHTPFMHNAEVVHLQDVANLVDKLYTVGIIAGVFWVMLLIAAYRYQLKLPSLPKVLLGCCTLVIAISAIILSLGPTKVFYWFHTQIFPEGHQWFFYYEESLMTTLMKAPDIFAFIALLLLGLMIILWTASIWASNKILKQKAPSATRIQRKKPKRKK